MQPTSLEESDPMPTSEIIFIVALAAINLAAGTSLATAVAGLNDKQGTAQLKQ